jgi:hypothetical protein
VAALFELPLEGGKKMLADGPIGIPLVAVDEYQR